MVKSEEEACKKLCIHERKLTDTGLCVARGCMYWQSFLMEGRDMEKTNNRRAEFGFTPIKLTEGSVGYGKCYLTTKK